MTSRGNGQRFSDFDKLVEMARFDLLNEITKK